MAKATKKKAPRPPAAPWGNRIVQTGLVRAGDLLAHPRNWRIHGKAQQQALGAVLEAIGFVQALVVNRRTDAAWKAERGVETVIDGHLRAALSLSRGEDTLVPVHYVDLTPEEERLVLATLDPIGAMAGHDADVLVDLANEVAVEWRHCATLDLAAILKQDRQRVQFEAGTATNVLVICGDSETQADLLERLQRDGFTCKPTSRS